MKSEIRYGFAQITMIVVIALLSVIIALSATVYMQKKSSERKDEIIRKAKSEKVKEDAEAKNNIHEVEHKTIGNRLRIKGRIIEEVNLSNGSHSINFK